MMSQSRFVPDAAYALRKASDAAITADTVLNAGALVSPIGAIWNDVVKDGKVVFFAIVSDLETTDTDETYQFDVITSANADLSSPTTYQSVSVAADGQVEILLDQFSMLRADPDAKYWGVAVNVGGTTPSVKVEAYVLPPVGL